MIRVITAQCVLAENRWARSATRSRCCHILNLSLGSFWYFLRWLFWPRCRSNMWKTKRHLRNQVKETNICNHVKDIYWKAYWQLTSQHHRTASWPLTNWHHGRASWQEHVGSHLAQCLILEPGCTIFVQYIYSYRAFFLSAPPEIAKCWPVSNWFQKMLESQTGPLSVIKKWQSVWRSEYDSNTKKI